MKDLQKLITWSVAGPNSSSGDQDSFLCVLATRLVNGIFAFFTRIPLCSSEVLTSKSQDTFFNQDFFLAGSASSEF